MSFFRLGNHYIRRWLVLLCLAYNNDSQKKSDLLNQASRLPNEHSPSTLTPLATPTIIRKFSLQTTLIYMWSCSTKAIFDT
jgi:hypothetical protein